MDDKNEEEKFIKLDTKDIGLLKNINKDNRYKDLKPVKEINDIIKDLKIYEDKIGEKCSKFINKIAEEGEFKKSKLIDNCKEIKDAIKKKEKEEKKKKGKKPRKGKATKDKAIKPLPEEKKKDNDINKKLIDSITRALKSKNIEKGITDALSDWARQICIDKVATPALNGIKKILDNPYIIPEKLLGWSDGQWMFSPEMYSAIGDAIKCASAVLTALGATLTLKKLKDWWNTVSPISNPPRDGNPPQSPDFGSGDDNDDDDDDDRPRRPKQIKGNNLLQIKDSSSIPNNSQIVAQNTGMDAYRQMLINAKRKSSNTLRDATNTQTDNLVNQYYKNLAKQNKESEPPKTDPPKTDEPPKTEPPQEETSYFRTGVNVLSTIGATALVGLYDSYYGQQAPVNTDGENIILDNSEGQLNVPDEPPQMPEEPNINMEGMRQEEGDIPPPRDEGLGRIDEDLEDAMSKERQEIEEAEEIEREDRKKTAEEVDKEEQIKKVEDFMNNMGVSRNAFASVINPKLAGLSTLQLQNPILIGSAISTGLDMLFGLPVQSEPQRSLTASVQEKQDLSELEKAETDRMKMLTGSEETTEQRIQREADERKEFDAQQEKVKQEQIKQQKELLEQKAREYTEQQQKAKQSEEEKDLQQKLKEMERKELEEKGKLLSLVGDLPTGFSLLNIPNIPFTFSGTVSGDSPSAPFGLMSEIQSRQRQRNFQQSATANILEAQEGIQASIAGQALLGSVGRPTNEFTLFHYTPIGQNPPSAMSAGTLRNIHNRTINRLEEQGLITEDLKRILNNEIKDFIRDSNNYNANDLLTAQARKDYMEIIKNFGLFKPQERRRK